MFFTIIFWWWWEFRLIEVETWTFQLYLFLLSFALFLVLLCAEGVLFLVGIEVTSDLR